LSSLRNKRELGRALPESVVAPDIRLFNPRDIWILRFWMTMNKPLRVLHCPSMVAGYGGALARTERELGLNSWSVSFQQNAFAFGVDEVLWQKADSVIIREFKRWNLLRRALRDFDAIHFNFGYSIMPTRVRPVTWQAQGLLKRLYPIYQAYASALEMQDLRWLKRAGKIICMSYLGDDARQGDYARANFDIHFASEVEEDYYTRESDQYKRERIALMHRYADQIYAVNPDLLHILPSRARFLPYGHIDLGERPSTPRSLPERPLVVHAPTHPRMKGTKYVLAAVERLRGEGVPFEFEMVQGLSHAEARQLYGRADLLIDQVLAGWYGGLAVELMALGRPVVCYIRQDDLRFIPQAMRDELPLITAQPETLYDVLKTWLTARREELPALGLRSRAFVERWHDPLQIATQLKRDYENALLNRRGA
jgi:hypothetical protein